MRLGIRCFGLQAKCPVRLEMHPNPNPINPDPDPDPLTLTLTPTPTLTLSSQASLQRRDALKKELEKAGRAIEKRPFPK